MCGMRKRGGWFDYLADSGDGQKPTYSIAYLCMSDLWITKSDAQPRVISRDKEYPKVSLTEDGGSPGKLKLPRGQILFFGGTLLTTSRMTKTCITFPNALRLGGLCPKIQN